ncbi:MAG TPA: 4Fe-4S binding protein [Armatimonadota bacterium]|jgi:polyferredoxin/NAD-dependent dihydropyrimidine dehydrogenase PreA subunit
MVVETNGKKPLSKEAKQRMAKSPGNAGAFRIVRIRRAVQVTTFLLFLLCFGLTTGGARNALVVPKNVFMSLDFLNTIKNGIASHHVAVAAIGPGLVILLLTLWGGRIFCGWICPLGTAIDITDRLLFRKGRLFYNPKRSESRRYRNWKYLYLLAGLGAIAYGVDILAFGDPLSLITRAFTLSLYGPVAHVWNGGIGLADHIGLSRLLFRATGLELEGLRVAPMSFFNAFPALLLFAGVLALSAFQERFWCRNLCPYGGLLALISRISFLRHFVKAEGCIHCKKCENLSRMGAYENLDMRSSEPIEHNIGECIQCFRCETVCPPDVIQIQTRRPRPAPGEERPEVQAPIDLGRRHVITAIGLGVAWAAAAKASAANYQGRMRRFPRNNRAIRPPGALPEPQFLSACTRCAECMKVCPTNALQPAMFETGPEGMWTPILVPSVGPCAEKCTACGDVCPTKAIRPFSWQDKRYKLKLGLANVNRSTCIAWNGGRDCVVCAEVCPYSAVVFRDTYDDTIAKDPTLPISAPSNKGRMKRVPTVDERLCTGCGICEYHCPVLPDHSIVVYTSQEDRDYRATRENPWDGFVRPDWEKRKTRGKDAEYQSTMEEFKARTDAEGGTPGAQ